MQNIDDLIKVVLNASIHVHKELGAGLLESVYEICLCREFTKRKISYLNQVPIMINYDGEELNQFFKADFIIEDRLILEIKAVEFVLPVHEAQLITYLKLASIDTGLLLNFNTVLLKNGIKRLYRKRNY